VLSTSARFDAGTDLTRPERKKKKGLLDPFDPSSSSCTHEHSRVRLNVNIRKKSSDVKVWTTFGPGGAISDISSLTELTSDSVPEEVSDDSEYFEEEEDLPTRRSIRNVNAQKPVKLLPFSPRKTRSRKLYMVEDSDENSKPNSEDELGLVPRTRSTRLRTRSKSKKADDRHDHEDEDERGDADDEIVSRKAIKPKKRRDKSFIRRAAYGRIRAVADLGYDSQSDDEIATLREHRSICEKCHRGPAHELIEALRKKPKGRAKRVSDDFEEELDDEERLNALGGWLRW
jgi:chromodomain-helicase-DNA-binding protein 4